MMLTDIMKKAAKGFEKIKRVLIEATEKTVETATLRFSDAVIDLIHSEKWVVVFPPAHEAGWGQIVALGILNDIPKQEKRIFYLAHYAKKKRVRKKNSKRLEKTKNG